jgi:sugar (pentulose or hexulose) kinase
MVIQGASVRGHAVVVDVGKTRSKLSLWTPDGELMAHRSRANDRVHSANYLALDAAGIEAWLAESLADLARLAPVAAIVPVAHGAAVAVVRDGHLLLPPMDYETPIPEAPRERYGAQREPFALTGSPRLPDGLNLGAQLHWLESLHPEALRSGSVLLPWPQYWAWRLCGIAASEVTSLGCHTDLWYPALGGPSALAQRRGWAARFAPLRHASESLGTLSAEWIARTGLPASTKVYCGLHDSNAALLGARGYRELAATESTVLSTGTWFVALRTPAGQVDLTVLPEARDCLVNVDVDGRPVPSSRFMGGREIQILTGGEAGRLDIEADQQQLLDALPAVLAGGARVLPTLAGGCGPFPQLQGRCINLPPHGPVRGAAAGLYAALVADVALDLIGAREQLLVSGRFAEAQVFVRALATLRPDTAVHVANARDDVACGALRVLAPALAPTARLSRVQPLAVDLDAERRQWRADLEHELIRAPERTQ